MFFRHISEWFHTYPVVLQHNSKECGAACLKSILKWYGVDVKMSDIINRCHITREGVSLLSLSKAAEQFGLDTMIARLSLDNLTNSTLPAILYWKQNHFVVLYKISNNKKFFYVADPGKGIIKYNAADFSKKWITNIDNNASSKGIALFIGSSQNLRNIDVEPKHELHTTKYILKYLHRHKKIFIHIFLGLIIGCIIQLLMPFFTQSIVDIGIKHHKLSFIWLILVGEFIIIMGRLLSDTFRSWLILHVSMGINKNMICDFFIKIMKLSMSFFETKIMGDFLERINDHKRIQEFLTNQILTATYSCMTFVAFGIVLSIYNHIIFIVFIIFSTLYFGWTIAFLKQRKIIDYELFELQSLNHSITYQMITSIQEIKLQNCEKRRLCEWENMQSNLYDLQIKALKLRQIQEFGCSILNEIRNLIIIIITVYAVIGNQISLGVMIAIQYIVGQLNSPMEHLMSMIYYFQDVKLSYERIEEVHAEQNEVSESNRTQFADIEKSIEFRNVEFKYNYYAPNNTIDNISFKIPKGKVTAIVGSSGSGKTTLLKIMLGYYKVRNGEVLISGENINEYNLKWWRNHCGVVMQDGVIFSESIAKNIAIESDVDNINRDKLDVALKTACLYDFVMSLPLKYDTLIGLDGIGLSLGQKQRILIARAVYKNPDYFFLDEATNSLDTKNENEIVHNLMSFYKGKTVVIIAHRLSTVKNADNIIVLNEGKIVEEGNHTTLIKNKREYFNLVKNQLEFAI